MANPNGRRSSFKNPQVQEELRNLIPQEVFRGSYSEYNLSNIARLSGNSQRGSLQRPRGSGIPTPTLRRAVVASSSSVSRNVVLAAPKSATSVASSSVSRSAKSNQSSQPQNILRTKSISNLYRRRSKSHESLSFHTPAVTPGRSRSKSPMSTTRRRGLHNDGGETGKSITVSKDKAVLTEMAKQVYEFLEDQDCQARPANWTNLSNPTKLSVAQVMGMFKFLASHFVGDSYFPRPVENEKGKKIEKLDDDIEKLMEVFRILKFPGTIQKTHLKTANTSFAWPGCLTALAWLTIRTQALLNPPSERTSIAQLSSNGLQEYAFESYLNLFPLHFSNELTNEAVEMELENFKVRVRESNAVELTKTKDELIQERSERLVELEKLNQEVDPSKEFHERFKAEVEVLNSVKGKLQEAENTCKHYASVNHLQLQQERIGLDINAKAAELLRIKQQISDQPLSRQEASALTSETATLAKQLSSIRHVNADLKTKAEGRRKALEACQQEFYEICKSFGVVERFNENLRFLRLDEYVVSPNPFSPKELEEWLKGVANTLHRSQARVNDVIKQVALSSEQKSKENQEFISDMNKLSKETDDINMKIQQVLKYNEHLVQEFERKKSEYQNQLEDANAELTTHEETLNQVQQYKNEASKALEGWQASLTKFQSTKDEWKNKLDAEMGAYCLYKAEMKQGIINMMVQAAKDQQQFYIEHSGVDIFEGLDVDSHNNDSAGA